VALASRTPTCESARFTCLAQGQNGFVGQSVLVSEMRAAPELQARLAYRLLVTETAPPPQPLMDDVGVASPSCSPLARRSREVSSATATHGQQSPVLSQHFLSSESCVQMVETYSAHCHWRHKSCCDQQRLLNLQLKERLQAAEAQIETLKKNHMEALEDLLKRLDSVQSQQTLNKHLAELEPQLALLEGMTTEQSRRLNTEKLWLATDTERAHGEAETENNDKKPDTMDKTSPATTKIASLQSPECSQRQLNEPSLSLRSRVPPRSPGVLTPRKSKRHRPMQLEVEIVTNSEKEVREMREWTRSQQSLEEALSASLKATCDQPSAQRSRAATPDWPKRARVLATQGQRSWTLSKNGKLHPSSPTGKTKPEPSGPGPQL